MRTAPTLPICIYDPDFNTLSRFLSTISISIHNLDFYPPPRFLATCPHFSPPTRKPTRDLRAAELEGRGEAVVGDAEGLPQLVEALPP